MRARGLRPAADACLLRADEHRRRAIDDAGGIAGMMHVIDILDLGMRRDRDRVEAAHLAHHHEGGLERGERLHVGRRAHVLVLGEKRDAVHVLHRRDRFREPALVPRLGGAPLALDRISIDIIAREAVFRRDEIGRDALRHEIGFDRDRRIDGPGAARSADADPAHGFDAAPDRHLMLAGHDLGRREIHRIEAGGAKAVDLHAGHPVAEIGGRARRLRAMSPPASPTGSTQPSTTSSTSFVSRWLRRSDLASRRGSRARARSPHAARRPACRGPAACGHDRR